MVTDLVNSAFQELKTSKKVTATAFDTGYESLSGFGYTYKKLLGQSPQNSLDDIKQAKNEISEYFNGKRKVFDVKIHTPGTDFQNSVWNCLRKILFGETATYKQQAERIEKPKAIRAVASANGFNRIAIIVPCHRVIGTNGKLTGYGGGIERKRWLLDHESGKAST